MRVHPVGLGAIAPLCWLRPSSARRTARQRLLPAEERAPVRMVNGMPTNTGAFFVLMAHAQRMDEQYGDG